MSELCNACGHEHDQYGCLESIGVASCTCVYFDPPAPKGTECNVLPDGERVDYVKQMEFTRGWNACKQALANTILTTEEAQAILDMVTHAETTFQSLQCQLEQAERLSALANGQLAYVNKLREQQWLELAALKVEVEERKAEYQSLARHHNANCVCRTIV
jgi:hypothetical protein